MSRFTSSILLESSTSKTPFSQKTSIFSTSNWPGKRLFQDCPSGLFNTDLPFSASKLLGVVSRSHQWSPEWMRLPSSWLYDENRPGCGASLGDGGRYFLNRNKPDENKPEPQCFPWGQSERHRKWKKSRSHTWGAPSQALATFSPDYKYQDLAPHLRFNLHRHNLKWFLG